MFDEAVVVFLIGPIPGELEIYYRLLPEADQVVIEELATIVRMEFQYREWQAGQDTAETIFHNQVTAPQHGYSLAPGRSHIDHLDGMDILPRSAEAAMMNQVRFEVAWLLRVPGDPFHGDISGYSIAPGRSSVREKGLVLPDALEDPFYS